MDPVCSYHHTWLRYANIHANHAQERPCFMSVTKLLHFTPYSRLIRKTVRLLSGEEVPKLLWPSHSQWHTRSDPGVLGSGFAFCFVLSMWLRGFWPWHEQSSWVYLFCARFDLIVYRLGIADCYTGGVNGSLRQILPPVPCDRKKE